ncbi:MAG: peptide deformylase [Dehalococcoidia bacterium]|nr:peptide deformylase [Dehalococcoidia bacterium]
MPGEKDSNLKQVKPTTNTVQHEVRTTGILALGILLLCFAVGALSFLTIPTVADRLSQHEEEGLGILMYPNNMVREVAEPVGSIGEEEVQLALQMENTMQRVAGEALSAPQVGVFKRMVVVRLNRAASDTEVLVMINPSIIEQDGSSTQIEGCLSVSNSLKIEVSRSERILVRFLTSEGEEVTLQETGANARIIQHAIDHLDGILIVDYAGEPKITQTVLLAIAVYFLITFVAVVLYILNRRKRMRA